MQLRSSNAYHRTGCASSEVGHESVLLKDAQRSYKFVSLELDGPNLES